MSLSEEKSPVSPIFNAVSMQGCMPCRSCYVTSLIYCEQVTVTLKSMEIAYIHTHTHTHLGPWTLDPETHCQIWQRGALLGGSRRRLAERAMARQVLLSPKTPPTSTDNSKLRTFRGGRPSCWQALGSC